MAKKEDLKDRIAEIGIYTKMFMATYGIIMVYLVAGVSKDQKETNIYMRDIAVNQARTEERVSTNTKNIANNLNRIKDLEFLNTRYPQPPEKPAIIKPDPLNNSERRKLRKAKER